MFFQKKTLKRSNIFNIGKGRACKPSTGYAFSFLIKQIQLLKSTKKNYVNVHKYLEKKWIKFFKLFKYNNEDGIPLLNLLKIKW